MSISERATSDEGPGRAAAHTLDGVGGVADRVVDTALDRLNALPAGELTALLRQCLAVPRWAEELAASRPYRDVDPLLDRADELSAGLTDDEIRQAVADHPRIGQRARAGSSTASWSAAEQSGVDGRDASLADRLAAGNVEYERRFGHIFLVCATGLDGEQILANLRQRLANDPDDEIAVIRRELAKIARLRLAKLLTEAAPQ